DDVVQQTLLQMHLSRDRFVRGAPVLPWAYSIALNALRDLRRRNLHRQKVAQALDDDARSPRQPDQLMEGRQRCEVLVAALRAMPEKLRNAFVLVSLEELPIAGAAATLGITSANIKMRIFRARQ